MKIEVWSIGKDSLPFIEEGVQFYVQKAKPYASIEFLTIPPPKRSVAMPIGTIKEEEGKSILGRLKDHHYLILFDERGKSLASREWASEIGKLRDAGLRTLVFLIGGPWGVSQGVRAKAKQVWTLSALTFPHQLVRLICAEQIYRSFSILNRSAYHHD